MIKRWEFDVKIGLRKKCEKKIFQKKIFFLGDQMPWGPNAPGDQMPWGLNAPGTKCPGDQMPWGLNDPGTKCSGDQMTQGPKCAGGLSESEP